MNTNNKTTLAVVTHDGIFHADEVTAYAILEMWAENNKKTLSLLRTRDQEKIDAADIVLDVGGEYIVEGRDSETGTVQTFLDHHQHEPKNFTRQPMGVPYATAGLAWDTWGLDVVGGCEEVWKAVDEGFIAAIDAADTGCTVGSKKLAYQGEIQQPQVRIPELTLSRLVSDFNGSMGSIGSNTEFETAVGWVKIALQNYILACIKDVGSTQRVREVIKRHKDNPIVIFEEFEKKGGDLLSEDPGFLYMIFPSVDKKEWRVQQVPIYPGSRAGRVSFPQVWRGKQGEELQKVCGVKTAVFCHPGGFIAGAVDKDDAITMASKSIQISGIQAGK